MSDSKLPLTEEAIKKDKLSSDFVDLSDDFGKFSEECAFLFDAFAAVSREPECITEHTSEGIRHLCYWLKYQVSATGIKSTRCRTPGARLTASINLD